MTAQLKHADKSANQKSRRIGEPFSPYGIFAGVFIPEAICKHGGLSPSAKIIYARLCRYAGKDGKAYPAMATLGTEVGLGEKQVRRHVRELEKHGFIRVDRTLGKTSHYVFLWHAAFEADNRRAQTVVLPEKGVTTPPMDGRTPPPLDGSQRESIEGESVGRESVRTDYQHTNRRTGDSHAGYGSIATEPLNENSIVEEVGSAVVRCPFSDEEQHKMSNLLNSYGQRRTMRDRMQEDAPSSIVQKCLEIVGDTPLVDIQEILRLKCANRGMDPGTKNGPWGWGWFSTVIACEMQLRRDQTTASEDPNRKTHWWEYPVVEDAGMAALTSAFDTLAEVAAA